MPHQNGAVPQGEAPHPQQAPTPQDRVPTPQPPAPQPPAPHPPAPVQQHPPTQSGYGYPPAQQQPVHPQPAQQQPAGPYEIRPGVPEPPQYPQLPQFPQAYVPNPNEPDWSALAAEHEAARKRKKRRLIIAVAAVVVIAGGGGAAALLLLGGKKDNDTVADDKKTGKPTVSSTATSATPSASPTPTMQGSELFAADHITVNGQDFARTITSQVSPCWKATQGGLGPILGEHKCGEVVLATYASGKTSVTVGVAIMPTAAEATATAAEFKGKLLALPRVKGTPHFCDVVQCALTHAAQGRYVYSTIAGPNNGKAGNKDADAIAAGHGVAGYTLSRLLELH